MNLFLVEMESTGNLLYVRNFDDSLNNDGMKPSQLILHLHSIHPAYTDKND